MKRVFLSHSSTDLPFVRLIRDDLCAGGLAPWLDESHLHVGASMPTAVSSAIEESDFFLLCASRDSAESSWVKKELSIAVAREVGAKRGEVMVVRLDDSPVPALVIDKVYVDLGVPRHYDREFAKLLARIAKEALPAGDRRSYCLTLDAARVNRLLHHSQDPRVHDWVLDYIVDTLPHRPRHTERYWAYHALGRLRDQRARPTIEKGLSEPDPFPRQGAQEAWEMLRTLNSVNR